MSLHANASQEGWKAIMPANSVSSVHPKPLPGPSLSDNLAHALQFAIDLHRERPQEGTTIPYVSHLFAVAALVLEHGGNEVQATAALLHHAIEDQGGTHKQATALKQDIRGRFGDEVLAIAVACADPDNPHGKASWRQSKEDYLAHLPTLPNAARIVSMADKLNDARRILTDHLDMGSAVWKRFNASPQDVIWYYQCLCAVYREMPSGAPAETRLLRKLEQVVAEIRFVARNVAFTRAT
jgi:(p)ppGpp synthase/HD superfamily hydrolase